MEILFYTPLAEEITECDQQSFIKKKGFEVLECVQRRPVKWVKGLESRDRWLRLGVFTLGKRRIR